MTSRVETCLASVVATTASGAPPQLAAALEYAVFPGGARVRPQLCLAVAAACGDDQPLLTNAAATAIELLHCASLVHDDLPCFDDAPLRRGKPSVHRAFSEPLAVLVGDALIVAAFDTLAQAAGGAPTRLAPLITLLAHAAGAPHGLVAGQAWESEPTADVEHYHRAKTGSLFTAATMAGALAAGCDPSPWRVMGARIGEAYQIADDLLDAVGQPHEAGKATLRDARLSRPNAVALCGVAGAVEWLGWLVAQAADAVPQCDGTVALRELVFRVSERLVPAALKQTAA